MNATKENKRPSHIVWQVLGEGEKARWHRVGAGWQNSDGKGVSLKLDSCPLDGRVVIRESEQNAKDPATPALTE